MDQIVVVSDEAISFEGNIKGIQKSISTLLLCGSENSLLSPACFVPVRTNSRRPLQKKWAEQPSAEIYKLIRILRLFFFQLFTQITLKFHRFCFIFFNFFKNSSYHQHFNCSQSCRNPSWTWRIPSPSRSRICR